jgi:F0F1-type ATP synthase membrane subunit c/vacuolar-type H+-ATPase subunit K
MMPSKKTARMGDKAKPLAAFADGFAVLITNYATAIAYEIISTSGDTVDIRSTDTVGNIHSDDKFARSRDSRRQRLPSELSWRLPMAPRP